MANHREIMGDKEIGEIPLLLKSLKQLEDPRLDADIQGT